MCLETIDSEMRSKITKLNDTLAVIRKQRADLKSTWDSNFKGKVSNIDNTVDELKSDENDTIAKSQSEMNKKLTDVFDEPFKN